MKITRLLQMLTGILFTGLLISASCKKNAVNPNVDQLSLLPPATQTGANTFGALVNGVAFVPQNQSILDGPKIQCNYIYTQNGYYLTILIANHSSNGDVTNMQVETDSLAIAQGNTYVLKKLAAGNATAAYNLYTGVANLNSDLTTNSITGQLTIIKLDQVNQIVSGTFNFNAVNPANDTVKVTNGRFDMLYTR